MRLTVDSLSLNLESIFTTLSDSKVGIWGLDCTSYQFQHDANWSLILGLPKQTKHECLDAWKQSIHPDDQEHILTSLLNCADGKTDVVECTFRQRHSEGHWITTILRGRRQSHSKSEKYLLIGTQVDITSVNDPLTVEKSQIPIVQAIRSIPIAMALLDKKLNFVCKNESWEKLLPCKGLNNASNYKEDAKWYSETHENLLKLTLKGEVQQIESESYKIDEQNTLWLNWRYIPWLNYNNKTQGVIVIATDVTQLINNYSQLHWQSKLIALGQMASGLAHEINNPLSVIRMNAEMLIKLIQEKSPPDKKIDKCNKIMKTTDRISGIIRALRSISASSSKIHFSWCKLDNLIDDVIELSLLRLRSENVKISVEMNSIVSETKFYLEPTHITQALINLINNAIDAISHLDDKWIKIKTDCNEQFIFIKVTDSGSGIPESLLEKIKERFFTTKSNSKGLGLGLNLTTSYVATHGGELNYELIDNHTTFIIKLPLSRIKNETASPGS